jgi:hypothetical protein
MTPQAFDLDIDAMVRRANRRTKREEATPLVIYSRDKAYGLARLASIFDYLTMHSWPPDYSTARVITNPDDLRAIQDAEKAIRAACKAADKVYAQAYRRGDLIDPAAAEAAREAVEA